MLGSRGQDKEEDQTKVAWGKSKEANRGKDSEIVWREVGKAPEDSFDKRVWYFREYWNPISSRAEIRQRSPWDFSGRWGITATIEESEEKIDKKGLYREGSKDGEWKSLWILCTS